jgi:hypothetical protein
MMFKMFKRKEPAEKFVEIVSWDGYTIKPVKGEIRMDRIEKARQEEVKNELQHVPSPEAGKGVSDRKGEK